MKPRQRRSLALPSWEQKAWLLVILSGDSERVEHTPPWPILINCPMQQEQKKSISDMKLDGRERVIKFQRTTRSHRLHQRWELFLPSRGVICLLSFFLPAPWPHVRIIQIFTLSHNCSWHGSCVSNQEKHHLKINSEISIHTFRNVILRLILQRYQLNLTCTKFKVRLLLITRFFLCFLINQ